MADHSSRPRRTPTRTERSYLEGMMPDLGLAATARNAYFESLQQASQSANATPSSSSDFVADNDFPDDGDSRGAAPEDE